MTLIGFGDYLKSIDTHVPKRSIFIHLQHIIVYCLIHYYRAIRTGRWSEEAKHQMRQLPNLENAQACENLLTELSLDDSTKGWAQDKSHPWILCGLNKHCSQMKIRAWERAKKHTNDVEVSHSQINRYGINQTLLAAVLA